jgi:hypothetical protein
MDFLLFGRELPAFELRIAMAKPPVLRGAQNALVRLRKSRYGRLETLRWLDVLLEDVELEALYTAYYMGMQRFADLIGNDHPVQLTFLERFMNWQENQFALPSRCTRDIEGLLREPALLPFVWMNWIPTTLPSTPSAPTAPFRVDFVFIVENRKVVIALGDLTNSTAYELDPHCGGWGPTCARSDSPSTCASTGGSAGTTGRCSASAGTRSRPSLWNCLSPILACEVERVGGEDVGHLRGCT